MKDAPRIPTRVTPTKVVYEEGKIVHPWLEMLILWGQNILEWGRVLIILLILVLVSTTIGTYTFRLLTLHNFSLETAMVAVFRSSPPESNVIWLAFVSGMVFLVINIKKVLVKDAVQNISAFVRFLAGVVLVYWFDIYWLKISPLRAWLGADVLFESARLDQIITAQVITSLLLLLLLPLGKRMVRVRLKPINIQVFAKSAPYLRWLRFILVVIAICYAVVFITGFGAPSNFVYDVPEGTFPFPIPHVSAIEAGTWFIALAAAAIFYWPPSGRNMRSFGLVRIILFLLSILAIGLIFQSITAIDGYVLSLSIAAFFAVSAIPVQRLLS